MTVRGSLTAPLALHVAVAIGLGATAPAAGQTGGTITGQCVTVAGAPIAGAVVTISALDREIMTDAEGRFAFSGIPAGEHTFVITLAGFDEHTSSARILFAGYVRDVGIITLAETPVREEEETRDVSRRRASTRRDVITNQMIRESQVLTALDLINAYRRNWLVGRRDQSNNYIPPVVYRDGILLSTSPDALRNISREVVREIRFTRPVDAITRDPSAVGGLIEIFTR